MPRILYAPAKRELTVRLAHLSETEACDTFLRLGLFLAALSEPSFACLGTGIVTGMGTYAQEIQPPPCWLCGKGKPGDWCRC